MYSVDRFLGYVIVILLFRQRVCGPTESGQQRESTIDCRRAHYNKVGGPEMGNHLKRLRATDMWATIEAFFSQGVTPEDLAHVRANPDHLRQVAKEIRSGREKDTPYFHYSELRNIMGNENCFLPDDWKTLYGVNFTKKQLREIVEFPWSEGLLNSQCPFNEDKPIKDTHFAFLGIEKINGEWLTIMKLHELHPKSGYPRFSARKPRYKRQGFANITCDFRWYLMLKEIVSIDTSRTYEDLGELLPPGYKVASAIEEVIKNILYFKKNGIYPNPALWALTDDFAGVVEGAGFATPYGHVAVGCQKSKGIAFSYSIDNIFHTNKGIGIAASLKHEVDIMFNTIYLF